MDTDSSFDKMVKLERAWRTLNGLERDIRKQINAAREFLAMDEAQLIANKKQFDFRYLRETTNKLEAWLTEQDELAESDKKR